MASSAVLAANAAPSGTFELASTASSSSQDLDKLISLFTGPNSADLYDRHSAAVARLCKASASGFTVRDLPKVTQVLELSLVLLSKQLGDFLQPVTALIRVLAKPFVRKSATDEVKALGSITALLAVLGQVFTGPFDPSLQQAAAQTLGAFATAQGNKPSVLDLATAQQDIDLLPTGQRQYYTNQGLVARSGIVHSAVCGLAATLVACSPARPTLTPSDDGAGGTLSAILQALLACSYTPDSCVQMLDAGVLQCLACTLERPYRHPAVPLALELLWNIAEFAAAHTQRVLPLPASSLQALSTGAPGQTASRPAAVMPQQEASSSGLQESVSPGAGVVKFGNDNSFSKCDDEAVPGSSRNAPEGQASIAGVFQGEQAALQAEDAASCSTGSVCQPLALALSNLLCTALAGGYAQPDKELRNDLLAVTSLLLAVDDFTSAADASGMFTALLAVGTCPELGSHPDIVQTFALSTESVDLELRLLAWSALSAACCQLPDLLRQACDAGLLQALLLYVRPNEGHPAIRRWNADSFASLRFAALTCLHSLSPLAAADYERDGGIRVLVDYLSVACASEMGSGGFAQAETALRHVHKLLVSSSRAKDAFGAAGLVDVLVMHVQDAAPECQPAQEGVLHFGALCLSALCSMHAENARRVRKAGGIPALQAQLLRLQGQDPLLPSPLAVALLEAIWTCVVPDRKSLAHFLVAEGMDQLLNLLECSHRSHRPVILSMLADILENPKSRSFLHDWRSDANKQTAAHMLLALWSEEDALRGMTSQGLLSNMQQPLVGLGKRMQWIPLESVAYGNTSASKKEVVTVMGEAVSGEALLSKLYAVFRVAGFGAFNYIDDPDRATLAVVEKYVKFKQGEVWQTIQDEFQAEGMKPTEPDRERLQSGIDLAQSLAGAVRDAQAAMLGRHQDVLKAKETALFESMHAQRRLESEMRFTKRDKSAMTLSELREAKAKKEAMLKASMSSFVFRDAVTADELEATRKASTAPLPILETQG